MKRILNFFKKNYKTSFVIGLILMIISYYLAYYINTKYIHLILVNFGFFIWVLWIDGFTEHAVQKNTMEMETPKLTQFQRELIKARAVKLEKTNPEFKNKLIEKNLDTTKSIEEKPLSRAEILKSIAFRRVIEKQEQQEILIKQEQLSAKYNDYFNKLTEQEQNEILEDYERKSN